MRNNFLICTLLAGLTQAIQLSGDEHQDHVPDHELAISEQHRAERDGLAQRGQPPKDTMIELKRERLEDLDFLQVDTLQAGTCGEYHDIVKNGQNIFYGVQSGSAEFIDPTFPHATAISNNANRSFVSGPGL
jgi:uncharacterized membrane protein